MDEVTQQRVVNATSYVFGPGRSGDGFVRLQAVVDRLPENAITRPNLLPGLVVFLREAYRLSVTAAALLAARG